jgi:hypothetical protein
MNGTLGIYSRVIGNDLPTHAIELRTRHNRAQQPVPGDAFRNLLLAFFLHQYKLSGNAMGTGAVEPSWASFGTVGVPARLPGRVGGEWPILDEEVLAGVVETFHCLADLNISDPSTSRDLALHRLHLGYSREDDPDALLDFVIALEALLLPDGDQELKYRFCVNGSLYLRPEGGTASGIHASLGNLYKTRSRLVHGGKRQKRDDVEVASNEARRFASIGLLRAVSSGFPTAKDFDAMLLRALDSAASDACEGTTPAAL